MTPTRTTTNKITHVKTIALTAFRPVAIHLLVATLRTRYHRTRTRYFSTDVPFLSTGTWNCAAKAAVFVNLYVELTISQSPPIGSFASTVMGASLWFRRVISYSNS